MVATQSIGLQAFAWKVKISGEVIENHNLKYERMQNLIKTWINRCESTALEVRVHKEYDWKTANTKLAPNSCEHVLGLHHSYVQFLNKKFGTAYNKKIVMFISPPDNSGIGGYAIVGKNEIYIKDTPFTLPLVHLHELVHLYQAERNLTFMKDRNNIFFIEGLTRLAEWEFREQLDFKKQKVYFQGLPSQFSAKEYFFPIKNYIGTNTAWSYSNGLITRFIQKPLHDAMVGFRNFDASNSYSYAFLVFYHFDQLARKRNKNFKIHKAFTEPTIVRKKSAGNHDAKNLFEQMTRKHLGMSFAAFEQSFQSNAPHMIRDLRMK
jgi:hypothetical protein